MMQSSGIGGHFDIYTSWHFDINLKHENCTLGPILDTPQTNERARHQAQPHKQEMDTMPPNNDSTERTQALAAHELSIAQLVGQVYESAPPAIQKRLLAQLIKPLGLLSLAAVANGIFASLRFRSAEVDVQARLESVNNSVQTHDVITLVNYVQQVSSQAEDGLADMLSASPVVAGSAAAAVLISVLMQRARKRRDAEQQHQDDLLA
jgi:hypothetical protein